MNSALGQLAQQGALGIVLAAVLAVFFWAFKVLVTGVIKHLEELTAAATAIRDNCRACRADSVSAVRDLQRELGEHIDHVVWKAHDQGFTENKGMIDAAAMALDKALTGVAQSVRAGNSALVQEVENKILRQANEELSRPHSVGDGVPHPVRG
jgi:hypothetical protein